jgi:hypothetical protein
MRVSLWFFGISAVAALAGGNLAAGCGSNSSSPPAPTTQDASANGPETSTVDVSCYVDASLTMFAASDAAGAGCAACVNALCAGAITSCETDCTCIGLFECLYDAGTSASNLGTNSSAFGQCVPGGITSSASLLADRGIKDVYNCFTVTCLSECSGASPPLDAGDAAAAASPEGGASDDAGATTPPEGGATGDAGDAGDAASDAGDSG